MVRDSASSSVSVGSLPFFEEEVTVDMLVVGRRGVLERV